MKIKFLDFNSRWKVHCHMEVILQLRKWTNLLLLVKATMTVIVCKDISEFKLKVSVLTRVYHCSLLSLNGCPIEGNERWLDYQFMPPRYFE